MTIKTELTKFETDAEDCFQRHFGQFQPSELKTRIEAFYAELKQIVGVHTPAAVSTAPISTTTQTTEK